MHLTELEQREASEPLALGAKFRDVKNLSNTDKWYFKLINLFLAVLDHHHCSGFSLVVVSEGYSPVAMCELLLLQRIGSSCSGFSSCSFQTLEHRLVVVVDGLSCPSAWEMFLGPGIKPMSPAWAGRFFTTEPPEKSDIWYFSAI